MSHAVSLLHKSRSNCDQDIVTAMYTRAFATPLQIIMMPVYRGGHCYCVRTLLFSAALTWRKYGCAIASLAVSLS